MSTTAVRARERRGMALAVIATAQLMVMLDMTIVNVALPTIQRSLHFSTTSLSWVIDAYVLVFGGLLLLGGRSGDIFGRRRMFLVGIALFAGASLLGGLATSQGWLIASRALQGVGAAIASPTALALVATTFPEGTERHRAMAVYASMTGAGGALGLVLGGLLVDVASWRWVLFVNVPIGVALLVAAPLVLPALDGHGGRLDVPGALTVSAGVGSIVYGLIHAPTGGWTSATTLLSFLVGLLLLGAFALIEGRTVQPLMPSRFLADARRTGGYVVMLLLGGAMLGLLYFLTQFLQEVLHYSPLLTGVAYLPIPFMVASSSQVVGRAIRHVGPRPFVLAGPALVGLGLLWASFLRAGDSYPHVLGPLLVTGLGMGLTFVPFTLNAVAGVANHEQGLASSLLNTSQQIGSSLGLAVLVTIAASAAAHPPVAGSPLSGAVHGFEMAVRTASGAAFLAAVVALVWVRPVRDASPLAGAR